MPIRPMPIGAATMPAWYREFQDSAARGAREKAQREHLEQTAPRVVVITVHGTFARNAKWTEPDSWFGQSLRAALAPALVVPSGWSAGNSVRARAEGVRDLRKTIFDVREKYPNARLAIVAHSHGGNIALAAMADETLAKATLGVATLGTPFLNATQRDSESLLGSMDGIVAAMFAGIAVFAVGAALGHGRSWWLAGVLTFAGVGLALLMSAYATRRMQRHANAICDSMPPTKLTREQLAIVRTSADEAAAALSGARVAGGLASIVWSMMTSRLVKSLKDVLEFVDYFEMRKLERDVMKEDSSIIEPAIAPSNSDIWMKSFRESVLPALPVLVLTLLEDGNAWARWLGALLAVGYGLPALLALLVSALSIPFAIVFALGYLPCGWTVPLAGPYLDLIAEPAPPGTWSVTQLRAGADGEMSHGLSHDDPRAIAHVCDWLKARLAAAEGGEPACFA